VEKDEIQLNSFQKSIESLLNEDTIHTFQNSCFNKHSILLFLNLKKKLQCPFSLDRKKKKCQLNIIVHNLEESTARDGPSKKQDDTKDVNHSFSLKSDH